MDTNNKRLKEQIKEVKRFIRVHKNEVKVALRNNSPSAHAFHVERILEYENKLECLELEYKKENV